jgi:glycerophosphoryl diester phosphodiesterase
MRLHLAIMPKALTLTGAANMRLSYLSVFISGPFQKRDGHFLRSIRPHRVGTMSCNILIGAVMMIVLAAAAAETRMKTSSVRSAVDDGLVICAHRSWLAPTQVENSLRQMRKTLEAGPFMLELDLTKSRDGSIFVMHDPTANRTTDGEGPLDKMSDAAASSLRLRDLDGRLTDERLPAFDDVARWAATKPDALLMLDIKKTPPSEVLPIVRRNHLAARVVLLTFDRPTAQLAFLAGPDVLVSVLVNSPRDLDDYRRLAGGREFAAYIAPNSTPELFRTARQLAAVVITDAITDIAGGSLDQQATRDGSSRYLAFFGTRPIDIVVTNHPQAIQKATASLGTASRPQR